MLTLELSTSLRTRDSLLSPQSLPGNEAGRLSQPAASLISVDALLDAETIGDIYALPFPLTFTPLLRPRLLAAAQDVPDWEYVAASYIDPCAPNELFHGTNGSLFAAFREVIGINSAFNNAAANFSSRHPKVWSTTVELYKSAHSFHCVDRHFDFPEAMPRDILMHVSSDNPGIAVPHDRMGALLGKLGLEALLDLRLDDPALTQALQHYYEIVSEFPNRDLIADYMSPLPSNCANILAGLTIHSRPVIVNSERVFSKAITKFEKI